MLKSRVKAYRQAVQGGGATRRLVREHAAHHAPEDLGRSAVVEGTVGRVHVVSQTLEGGVPLIFLRLKAVYL